MEPGGELRIDVPVTNTGGRRGAEVIQLYVVPPGQGRSQPGHRFRPLKELRAFAKVWLEPGESTTVHLELNERSFAYYDVEENDWAALLAQTPGGVFNHGTLARSLHRTESGWYLDAGVYQLHIGRSSADISHVVEVEVAGSSQPLPVSLVPQ